MQGAEMFETAEKVALSANSLATGMKMLCKAGAEDFPHKMWGKVQSMDFDADAARIGEWWRELETENGLEGVEGLYVGSSEICCDQGDFANPFVEACKKSDFSNEEWRLSDVWDTREFLWPGEGLRDIWKLRGDEDFDGYIEYYLALGYVSLAAKEIGRTIGFSRADRLYLSAGFDDGDYMVVGMVDAKGWHPRKPGTEMWGGDEPGINISESDFL